MPTISTPFFTMRRAALAALACGVAALSGCYVVPIHPAQSARQAPAVLPAAPAPITFTARLYPANDIASGYGMVGAVVTNDLHGRGTFSTVVNGESFSGEATRSSGSNRDGIANGTGNRGGYISCNYRMNSATQGVGQCKLSTGGQFTMHIGS